MISSGVIELVLVDHFASHERKTKERWASLGGEACAIEKQKYSIFARIAHQRT